MGLIDRWDRDERASRVMTMIQVYKLIMTTSMIQIDAMMVNMTDRVHWDNFKWESLAFSEFWFSFQEYVGCCGASGNRLVYSTFMILKWYQDYIYILMKDNHSQFRTCQFTKIICILVQKCSFLWMIIFLFLGTITSTGTNLCLSAADTQSLVRFHYQCW